MALPKVYTNPVLADKYIQYLQQSLDELSWLELVYPAVRVGVDEEGMTYPMVYANDGSSKNYSVLFDTDRKAYAFFEYDGDIRMADGVFNGGDADMVLPLAVVVWGRLDYIYPTKQYDYTMELVKDVIGKLKDAANYSGYNIMLLSDMTITTDYDRVFSRYTLHDETTTAALMRNRTAFRIAFSITVDAYCEID